MGRRVVNYRLGQPNTELGELTYLLESGSDRIGALDFQNDPRDYVARRTNHPDTRRPGRGGRPSGGRPADRRAARDRSLGRHGDRRARPKALLSDKGRPLIAKFSSSTDTFPVVQGEYVAMELAARAGIRAAPVGLTRVPCLPGTRCFSSSGSIEAQRWTAGGSSRRSPCLA